MTAKIVFTKPNETKVIQNAVVDSTEQTVTVDLMADCVRSYGNRQKMQKKKKKKKINYIN